MSAVSLADRSRVERLSFYLYFLAVIALCVAVVMALVGGDFVTAGLAAGVLIADWVAALVVVCVAITSVLAGSNVVAALAVLVWLSHQLAKLGGVLRTLGGPDPEALTVAASELPVSLHAELRGRAGRAPITTLELIAVASASNPQFWRPLRRDDPAPGSFDGPLVADGRGGECSQYAAEAIGLAVHLGRQLGRPLDADLLAGCAAWLPLSAAGESIPDHREFATSVLGIGPDQLVHAMSGFVESAAGGDIARRAELAMLDAADAFPREWLASASGAGLLALRLCGPVVSAAAFVWVVLTLPWGLMRWLVRLPGRGARTLARGFRALGRSARSSPSPARAEIPAPDHMPGYRRWLAPWAGWPTAPRALWLFGRPTLALAAVAAALVVNGLLAGGVVLAAALIRPLRRRYLAVLAAAAVAPLSAAGAVVLAGRAVLGELVIWRLGRPVVGTSGVLHRGLDRMIATRLDAACRAGGFDRLELGRARDDFEVAVRTEDDDDTIIERAAAYASAAWAEARPLELLRIARRSARGLLLGQWSGSAGHTSAFGEVRRLAVLETSSTWVARWGIVALGAAVAAAVFPQPSGPLGSDEAVARGVAAAATLMIAIPLTRSAPSFFGLAIGAAAAWAISGDTFVELAGVAVIASIATSLVRTRVGGLFVSGRRRWRGWPVPRGTPWRLRSHWRAANEAADAARHGTAIDMLRDLARDEDASDELAAAALGRVALLEIERGRLEAAAVLLDELSTRFERLSGPAAVAAGLLSSALGDLEHAERLLRDAVEQLDEGSPLTPRAVLSLADVFARRGRPDDAVALLARQRAQPFAVQGIDALLDTEVAIAAALAARGERVAACERLDEIADLPGSDGFDVTRYGRDFADRIAHSEARLLVLRAQLALEDRRDSEAESRLRRAVQLLTSSPDGALRAAATLLHGVALAHTGQYAAVVEKIKTGSEELEARRTQLRVGDRRTAMIAASEKLYAFALRGLARTGLPEAGVVAATLVESLSRNAIAATLKSGTLPLGERGRALVDQIAAGETVGADVDELRRELGHEVSARFAAAYLPTATTPEQLREIARSHGHVLMFYVPVSGLPGWRVWIAPSGEMQVDEIVLDGSARSLFDEVQAHGGFPPELIYSPLSATAEQWQRLADVLLPRGLRAAIAGASPESPERVLIVPDGVVALVPWAALHVVGEALLRRAVIQIAPALVLAAPGVPRDQRATAGVVAHLHEESDELRMLGGRTAVELAHTRAEFLGALNSGAFAGAYLAMHGDETGLRQRVAFADGSTLSAATALVHTWPPWTVFASCLVGRVDQTVGQEPLGLAISCMLGGADAVIASVVAITAAGAASVCGGIAADLAGARHPADALRDAQLAHLEKNDFATVASGLGLVCIATTRAPAERPASTWLRLAHA